METQKEKELLKTALCAAYDTSKDTVWDPNHTLIESTYEYLYDIIKTIDESEEYFTRFIDSFKDEDGKHLVILLSSIYAAKMNGMSTKDFLNKYGDRVFSKIYNTMFYKPYTYYKTIKNETYNTYEDIHISLFDDVMYFGIKHPDKKAYSYRSRMLLEYGSSKTEMINNFKVLDKSIYVSVCKDLIHNIGDELHNLKFENKSAYEWFYKVANADTSIYNYDYNTVYNSKYINMFVNVEERYAVLSIIHNYNRSVSYNGHIAVMVNERMNKDKYIELLGKYNVISNEISNLTSKESNVKDFIFDYQVKDIKGQYIDKVILVKGLYEFFKYFDDISDNDYEDLGMLRINRYGEQIIDNDIIRMLYLGFGLKTDFDAKTFRNKVKEYIKDKELKDKLINANLNKLKYKSSVLYGIVKEEILPIMDKDLRDRLLAVIKNVMTDDNYLSKTPDKINAGVKLELYKAMSISDNYIKNPDKNALINKAVKVFEIQLKALFNNDHRISFYMWGDDYNEYFDRVLKEYINLFNA